MNLNDKVAIQINNLKFSYNKNLILNISYLNILQGEIVFLHGASGTGKSTLLELMSGILKADEGELSLFENNLTVLSVAELDRFRSENIGYIFQSFNLIPYLTVTENIMLTSLFSKTKIQSTDFDYLITSLGLANYTDRPVSQLSVGQQQRVAVARALIKKPKIILADEPTSALDYDRRSDFLNILFKLCRENKTTVLFVSHDLNIAHQFDRVIDLEKINNVKTSLKEII